MEGRNFHQERDGSKGGFRKPFLPIVPLKASPPSHLLSFSPKGRRGRRIFRRLMSAAPHSPPPKSNPLSLLSVECEILQSIRWRPDPTGPEMDWHSTFRRNFLFVGGFERAQTGHFHRLILLPPFNSAGQANEKGGEGGRF